MTLGPYSRSCRTASIRSGIAGGLAGELVADGHNVLDRSCGLAWIDPKFPTTLSSEHRHSRNDRNGSASPGGGLKTRPHLRVDLV